MTPRRRSVLTLFLAATAAGACQARPPARGGDSVAVRPPPSRDSATAPVASTAAPPARDHLLLAVDWSEDGGAAGEAIAVLPAGGGYRAVPFADSLEAFYARWLDRGHRYTVLRDGRPAGTVTVGESDLQGCAAATAVLDVHAARPESGSGLATDLSIAAGQPFRRPATPAQAPAMTALLRQAVTEHGGAWTSGADVRVAAVSDALVGSVEVPGDGDDPPRAAAFVIAERAGGAYRPVVVWVPGPGAEGDEERPRSRLLLDAVDLDGDGHPELVARTGFSEWSQYTIYRRGPGGWTAAYEQSGGGC